MSGPDRRLRTRLGWLALAAAVAGAGWLLRDELRPSPGGGGPGDRPAAAAPADTAAAPADADAGRPGADGPDADTVADPGGAADDGGAGPATDSAAAPAHEPGDPAPAAEGARAGAERDPAERLRRLFGPGGSGRVELDSADLALLLGPRRPWRLPDGVSDPRAVPGDSLLEASAMVETEQVLDDRVPAMLRRMLGDSARVRAKLSPRVSSPGVLRVRVRDVRAGSVTFPPGLVPWMLTQLGLPTAADEPSAVEVAPGRGLSGARVEDGVLVLTRDPTP